MKYTWIISIIFIALVACSSEAAKEEETGNTKKPSLDQQEKQGSTDEIISNTGWPEGLVTGDGHYVIKGQLINAGAKEVYLQEYTKPQGRQAAPFIPIDTAKINPDGSFQMEGKVKERRVALINVGGKFQAYLVIDGGSFTIRGDFSGQAQFNIEGNQGTVQLNQFIQYINPLIEDVKEKQTQSYQGLGQKLPEQQLIQLNEQELNAYKAYYEYIFDFLDKTGSPVAAFYASEMIDPGIYYDELLAFHQKTSKMYPGSMYVQRMGQMLDSYGQLMGKQAPEINIPNPDGKNIALSSLKGKVVLIDFWASWCGPCRRENPNVVRTYNKYKDKGFTIYSVSLDKQKDRWLQAIAKDNLVWDYHVSELAGWQTQASKPYGVSGIPATFLIDEEGIIIGRNLRGSSLELKLSEVFD